MNDLTISIKDLRKLMHPVLPSAGNDDMLPILACVYISTHGKDLIAVTTDRFQLAASRVTAQGERPEWSALVPVSTIKAILAAFKPSRRDSDPQVTLTVSEDGWSLRVEGSGALLDMLDATISYPLEKSEYPSVGKLFTDASAEDHASKPMPLDPRKLSRLVSGVSDRTLQLKFTEKGVHVTDPDENSFVGFLMGRRRDYAEGDAPAQDLSWASLAGPVPTKATESTSKKKGKAA